MRVIGVTGVMGSGKSTTAGFFASHGLPVHDADKTVHALYQGPAAPLVEAAFPGTTRDGSVDRAQLAAAIVDKPAAIRRLENIVHPLVIEKRNEFISKAEQARAAGVVLDVPLLFETEAEQCADVFVVTTADAATLRERVMARPGMTEAKYQTLMARQMTDTDKRQRAHFIVDTTDGFDATGRQVAAILRALASTV